MFSVEIDKIILFLIKILRLRVKYDKIINRLLQIPPIIQFDLNILTNEHTFM